jgi:hypothetical protein
MVIETNRYRESKTETKHPAAMIQSEEEKAYPT